MARKITMNVRNSATIAEVFEDFTTFKTASGMSDTTIKTYYTHIHSISKHLDLNKSMDIAFTATIGDGNASVEELTERALDMAALHRAVDQLEPQQRELLCMVYEEGRSCASIARDDGVSEYAVRDRLYRIHKKLKNFLQ